MDGTPTGAVKIRLRDGLPFVSASLVNKGQTLLLSEVILDTGSATTVFSVDKVNAIGLRAELDDIAETVRGVGGIEVVLPKQVDQLVVGNFLCSRFTVQMGAMDYGFDIDGILGLDFLMQVKAIIDLDRFELRTSNTAELGA